MSCTLELRSWGRRCTRTRLPSIARRTLSAACCASVWVSAPPAAMQAVIEYALPVPLLELTPPFVSGSTSRRPAESGTTPMLHRSRDLEIAKRSRAFPNSPPPPDPPAAIAGRRQSQRDPTDFQRHQAADHHAGTPSHVLLDGTCGERVGWQEMKRPAGAGQLHFLRFGVRGFRVRGLVQGSRLVSSGGSSTLNLEP